MNRNLGLETLRKAYAGEIRRPSDAVVLVIHWCLLQYGLVCCGLEDNFCFESEVLNSELLPDKWNQYGDLQYKLKYRHTENLDDKFLLSLTKDGFLYTTTLLKVSTEQHTTMSIYPNEEVRHINQPLKMRDDDVFVDKVRKQLLDPLMHEYVIGDSRNPSKDDDDDDDDDISRLWYPPKPPKGPPAPPDPFWDRTYL